MNCRTCKFYKPGVCIKNCLQIYFKYDPSDPKRFPVTIHKSEVAYIEIGDKFLAVVDIEGTQHNYSLDTITHYHVPDFCKINSGIAESQ